MSFTTTEKVAVGLASEEIEQRRDKGTVLEKTESRRRVREIMAFWGRAIRYGVNILAETESERESERKTGQQMKLEGFVWIGMQDPLL